MTNVLVLDDEESIRDLIGEVALEFGFTVDTTGDPADFQNRVSAAHPDLIVLDLVLPTTDGIEMIRFLESTHYKSSLILISGMDDRVLMTAQRLGKALGLNVLGTIRKPFKLNLIRELFGKAAHTVQANAPAEFRRAITNNELVLHYQPVVDVTSNRVLGVEALVRWAHPTLGLVMPDNFLPDFAREGLMTELTWWVVRTALETSAVWKKEDIDLRIALNVSSTTLIDPSFSDVLANIRKQVEPARPRFMFELTETEAMNDPVRMMEVLSRLRLGGIELAIDDFGTGYSSLVELRRLPVNHLKIDKSFVMACINEPDAAAITRAVIELSHALGLKVVAEGVETKEIWNQLLDWRCDAVQGYLISRPLPGPQIPAWIRSYQSQ